MKKLLSLILFAILLSACHDDTTLAPDTQKPTLTISSPNDNSTLTENEVTVTGRASDNTAVTKLEYRLNANGWQDVTLTNGTFSISITGLQEGENTITVRAQDAASNTTEETLTLNFNPTPSPTVTQVTGQVPNWQGGTGSYALLLPEFTLSLNDEISYGPPFYSAPVSTNGSFTIPLGTPTSAEMFLLENCPQAGFDGTFVSTVMISTVPTPTQPDQISLFGGYGVRTPEGMLDLGVVWFYADRDAIFKGDCDIFTLDVDFKRGWNPVVVSGTDLQQLAFETKPAPAGAAWIFEELMPIREP